MADVFILDRNRGSLKTIFARHSGGDDSLPFAEMLKFGTAARIYPVKRSQDLVSSLELKRLFYKAADRFSIDDPRVELSYFQFEKLLKLISSHCFSLDLPPSDRVQLLLSHIQTHCQAHYKVPITVGTHVRRVDSFDSANSTKPVLRKQSSLSGMSPVHRKSMGKPLGSVSRLNLVGNSDSASTERVSTSRAKALTQKVEKLYQMMSPKGHRNEVRVKLKGGRKGMLSVESPRSGDRLISMPESTRRLSDMLSQLLSMDKKHSDSSGKIVSPLQLSFGSQDAGPTSVIDKVRRAVGNFEAKTDIALRRTPLQGKQKYAMRKMTDLHRISQEKVVCRQRWMMKLALLRWKCAVRDSPRV